MNTIIISSSLAAESKSFVLCKEVAKRLQDKGVKVDLVDAKTLDLNLYHQGMTDGMSDLAYRISMADNIIFGMGVHNYSINDGLKAILDNCCAESTGKFFGILCAAGGDRSYLSTIHLTQICMNQWRMIQLPRVIYATGKDFADGQVNGDDICKRLDVFSDEFFTIGSKLSA